LCFLLRRCWAAHWRQAKSVPLLGCERDVLAGVWSAEERREGDGHVDQKEELNCVNGVARVRSVADDLDRDARRVLA
jgi:hypothetical protein